ncbi:unnamed protein product [Lactuca saligna]|uniref:Uncharacterized protein n=1 Tax=Lactuca saligna TaxID=75948 RepID=A0AA35YVG8_LACSI|nr:unnamed protein product [Lactuca saligna]
MGVSQPQAIFAQSTPLFTDLTTTTTTSTSEPPVSINASNAGASASDSTLGHSTPPISPLCQDDQEIFDGDDEEDFGGFTYSPFNIRIESDDEAPITRGKFKALTEKLDSLIESTKTSSRGDYSQETIKAFFETLTKEHSANLEKTNQAINASASIFKETTEKIEKDAQEKVHTGILSDNSKLHTSFSSKIYKLHEDVSIDKSIANKLIVKIEKVKVLFVKIAHVEQQITTLLSEKAVMKICVEDMNALLSDIIEIRDSLIMITVRKHLAEKLRHVFVMLNRTEADTTVKPKSEYELKVNVALSSRGIEKIIDENDEEETDEHELKRRKAR